MRQRPAGATSTRDGEPLPGAEKKEATTRQRPAGATSTEDGEPLPGTSSGKPTSKKKIVDESKLVEVNCLSKKQDKFTRKLTASGKLLQLIKDKITAIVGDSTFLCVRPKYFSAAQTFPMDQHGNLTNWQRMFEVFEPNSDVSRKEAVNGLSPHWFDKNKELISPKLIIKTEQITDENMDSESSSGTEASDTTTPDHQTLSHRKLNLIHRNPQGTGTA